MLRRARGACRRAGAPVLCVRFRMKEFSQDVTRASSDRRRWQRREVKRVRASRGRKLPACRGGSSSDVAERDTRTEYKLINMALQNSVVLVQRQEEKRERFKRCVGGTTRSKYH